MQMEISQVLVTDLVEHRFFFPYGLQGFGGFVVLGGFLVLVVDGHGGGVKGKGPLHVSLYFPKRNRLDANIG